MANIHTTKIVDTEFIESVAFSHGGIVTVEDHGVSRGLGSAVAEAVAEFQPRAASGASTSLISPNPAIPMNSTATTDCRLSTSATQRS